MKDNNNQKTENRGGARKGAGRKKTAVKKYVVCATQEVAEILESISGSKSDYICKAIIHYHKNTENCQ